MFERRFMKYLTIVTNFEGAHIGVPSTALSSLDMLKDAVRFEKAEAISVLGGGDPLFEYENHQKYYQRLFRICREMNIPLELHTKYVESEFPYGRCKNVTYQVQDFDQLTKIAKHGREWVRVEFIVGKSCTLDLIDKVADYYESSDIIHDLCFLVNEESHLPKNCKEYLRKGDPSRWTFIEHLEADPPYFINGEIRYHWSDISA
jgi:hypothetical protein